ncbi:hypothetical protein O181_038638 [Austropuccinia psidii MF-1]|uniref:Reverse transcriptase domain-containing protein n=1 Tax=Austropuccinia psidii MF-1 TaxID=1389203 RepID=A0A9Q3HB68_9BASI|nr:hypothetical protein [Austropuccinia psidii MF-1]
MKYKSADTIRKCHICQSTTHLANTCPKKGKINEIDIEKDDIIEDNSDDKSSIFSDSAKDIENINATLEIMEYYSHLPQVRNSQLDLSKFQDAHLMKAKPNRGKGYKSCNSCITEVVIDNKPTKSLLDPGAFFSCVVNKVLPVNLELKKFRSEPLKEVEISLHLTDKQENELSSLLYDHKGEFASDKEPQGEIIGHEVDIILNIERPYPPLLRRPAYPASPKSREALETHIKDLLDVGVIRNVGHNEEVEITTPVIVAWHNGKSRMVGDFGALNTYTVPDKYPIPKIQISLTQISQEVYISTMDSLKGFHQNVVTPRARKYLRIIVHCGVCNMTIVHKDWNIHKNSHGLSRLPLPNNIYNPAYVPEEASSQIPIEGISVTDLNTISFEEVTKIYTVDKNCSILCQLLTKECKDHSLIYALDELWMKSYDTDFT